MALKPTTSNPYAAKPAAELYGIDGWLRLVQFHMGLYVLFIIFRIFNDFRAMSSGPENIFLIIDIAYALFQIGLLIISFTLMIKKFMLFRVFYTILLGAFLLDSVMGIWMGDIGTGIYDLIVGTIWIVYLYKSVRIKNTFRKLGEAKTEYEIEQEEKRNKACEITQ